LGVQFSFRSNFKSETIFGFLSPNYKISKRACLASFCVLYCLLAFFNLISIFELKIDVLVSRTNVTSVNLVCDCRLLVFKQEIDASVLKYRWYAWSQYYRVYVYQLDFLKNQFRYKPRHLRRTWYLGTRIFDKANPNLLGVILFEHYLESYFEKEVKNGSDKIISSRFGFSSPRAFQRWSRICRK